ncbi:hypothetical protein Goshw_022946 [Gossypium schwendimanii]|uniref:Uncharacterized protein n=1 Tax=Gossypium schwendimanii TaxID=34291 RepID=A0A7J9KU52_GOSSC|nr:hypothetical protein [Gossypium schwendimanii]
MLYILGKLNWWTQTMVLKPGILHWLTHALGT